MAILYVDAGAEGGNGSAEAPFASIQKAIWKAKPGDTIMVAAGTYVENIKIRDGGAADAPITIVSADGPGKATIKPESDQKETVNIAGADHVVLDGFKIEGPDSGRPAVHIHAIKDNTDFATDVTITNCDIRRGDGDGIKVSKSDHIVLAGNEISGGGDSEAAIDLMGAVDVTITGNLIRNIDNIGIMVKGGSSDVDIVGNTLENIKANAMEIGGYSPEEFYRPGFIEGAGAYEAMDVVVAGNVIDDVDNTAIRFIGAQDAIVASNQVSNAQKTVTIDDSSKFHEPWLSDELIFGLNDFEGDEEEWIIDRSEGDYTMDPTLDVSPELLEQILGSPPVMAALLVEDLFLG